MKDTIIKLLKAHNRKTEGIYIGQEIDQYVSKLMKHSKIICVHEHDAMQGFISFYKNDPHKKLGYLSMLLINKENQSKGMGSFLLSMAIADLKREKYEFFQLEVLKNNDKAIKLYSKFGFKVTQEKEFLYLMQLNL